MKCMEKVIEKLLKKHAGYLTEKEIEKFTIVELNHALNQMRGKNFIQWEDHDIVWIKANKKIIKLLKKSTKYIPLK